MQASRPLRTVQDIPDEVLERILARVPTAQERVSAGAVCRTWHQLLSHRNLRLFQAVSIGHQGKWDTGIGADGYPHDSDPDGALSTARLRMFLPLQQWLLRRGGSLLQLQCSTAFNTGGMGEDGLLTALLAAIPSAAPSLQALRLDGCAADGMVTNSLAGLAGMGGQLRQLAILGLQHVSDASLMAALVQLPRLQDLAIMFEDEETRFAESQWLQCDRTPAYGQPDIMLLLDHVAVSCPAPQTLALGNMPSAGGPPGTLTKNASPLPSSLSRLTALTALALHDMTWEHSPDGLPDMPQLRRFHLRGDCELPAMQHQALPHQLSTLIGLEALQGPPSPAAEAVRPREAADFLRFCLPPLNRLRHLAFHNLREIGGSLLQNVCFVADRALWHLISLHLVNCNIGLVPLELCGLSHLQLLNLSHNPLLHDDGCRILARRLCTSWRPANGWICAVEAVKLARPETVAVIAGMPALEQLALDPTVPYVPLPDLIPEQVGHMDPPERLVNPSVYINSNLSADETEVALLAQHRAPGLPPIRIVSEMPISDRWAAVAVDLPFEPVNEVLGVQLERSIISGVPP